MANNSHRPSFRLLFVATGSARIALTPVYMEFNVLRLILSIYATCLLKALEIFPFGSQTRAAANKHLVHNFHIRTVHLDIIKAFYSPTNAQEIALKLNFNIVFKTITCALVGE